MSKTRSVLPDNATVERVFKTLETETTALLKHLDLAFLTDYLVFAPLGSRANTSPELLKGAFHYFYREIYGFRPMPRELHNEDFWRQWGFERPPSRRTLSRSLAGFELVAEDVFIELVHEFAERKRHVKVSESTGQTSPLISVMKTLSGTTTTLTTTSTMATAAVS